MIKTKIVKVYRKDMFWRCWIMEGVKYPTINGFSVHKGCAIGNGELVRHLCGNSSCCNPLHHRCGTSLENAKDRTDMHYYTKDLLWSIYCKYKLINDRIINMTKLAYGNKIAYELKNLAKLGYSFGDQWNYAKYIFKRIVNSNEISMIIMEDNDEL